MRQDRRLYRWAGVINRLDGDFVASPKILTPADLKGKNLGVQSIGGGIWTFSMLALDHWGLVPERDKIQFRILGDQSVIAQGLVACTVDAAYLGYTFSKTVQRNGFHVLQDFANIDIPYQGIGIVARKSILDQSPDIAERTLKALSRSIAYYRTLPMNRILWRSCRSGCVCKEAKMRRPAMTPCGVSTTAGSFRPLTACATLCASSTASIPNSAA